MQLPAIKEDRLEKFREHLFSTRPLSEADQKLFEKYFFTYSLLCDGKSERQAVKAIMSDSTYGQSQSQAYAIVRDAQEIFGQIKTAKKDAKRNVYITRLEELAAKLEAEGDYEEAGNLLMKAAKLQGLLEKNAPYVDPKLFLPKPNLIFTDDIDAVTLTREVEDGDAEVID